TARVRTKVHQVSDIVTPSLKTGVNEIKASTLTDDSSMPGVSKDGVNEIKKASLTAAPSSLGLGKTGVNEINSSSQDAILTTNQFMPRVIQSDLFSAIPDDKFDYIFFNPPY